MEGQGKVHSEALGVGHTQRGLDLSKKETERGPLQTLAPRPAQAT